MSNPPPWFSDIRPKVLCPLRTELSDSSSVFIQGALLLLWHLFVNLPAGRKEQSCSNDHDSASADGKDGGTDAAGGGKDGQFRVGNASYRIAFRID